MVRDLDFGDRDVRAIYCHLYYFEIPPEENWAVEEKCLYTLPTGDRKWLLEPQTLLAGSAAQGVEAS
jgi:hypothetical protein